ncbi:MAG: hypothetical protein ACP6IP_00835 [Candidatus Njordarchaeia archaeon]
MLINISNVEKTVIDSFCVLPWKTCFARRCNKSSTIGEKAFKIQKIDEVSRENGQPTVNQRLGFLLEKMDYGGSSEIREKLGILNRYVSLDPAKPLINVKRDKKWRIIINSKNPAILKQ